MIRRRYGAFVVAAATFLFRWLTLSFDNEEFMHVALAADMARGRAPARDFAEFGVPLQILLSYAGLRIGGWQMLAEGLISAAAIAVGAGFTWITCRRLLFPGWLAVAVTVTVVVMYPRLYGYPKALLYPAAAWAVVEYAFERTTARVAVAAIISAIGVLFRYDHGAWIALLTGLAVIAANLRDGRTLARHLAVAALVGGLVVSPWAGWVLVSGHADRVWAFATGRGDSVTEMHHRPETAFTFDRSASLVTIVPLTQPRIRVRWSTTATVADKQSRIERYALQPVAGEEDVYLLGDTSRSRVLTLLRDPLIDDTAGIDRRYGIAPPGAFTWGWWQLERYLPVLRLRLFPGAAGRANAQLWLAWVTFLVGAVTLAVAVAVRVAAPADPDRAVTLGAIVPLALVSLLLYQTMVRGSPDSRLGDVAGITMVLLGWVVWRARLIAGAVLRRVATTAAVLVLAVSTVSAFAFGRVGDRLAGAGVDGPTNLLRRARDVREQFGGAPLDVFAPRGATGVAKLARWIHACTAPGQRVSVIGFEPQVFLIADRGFAGGVVHWDNNWFANAADQQLIIQRWSREDVPIVIGVEPWWTSFREAFDRLRPWLDERYVVVAGERFGGGKDLVVLARREATPSRPDEATGLPCFQ